MMVSEVVLEINQAITVYWFAISASSKLSVTTLVQSGPARRTIANVGEAVSHAIFKKCNSG